MNTTLEVAPERSGWRDERISRRHRMWGWDCPALDIDFLMLEYNHGLPMALVEFKHEKATPVHMSHPSMRALKALADRSRIPLFITRYADDFSQYYVTPTNDNAREFLPERTGMTELDWVKLLYRCRGLEVPKDLMEQLV